MKKIVTLIISAVMVLSMTVAASAAFVASPSLNAAPVLVEIKEGKTEDLVIKVTAYKDRANLPAEDKAAIEDSYKDIKNASNLTTLTEALKAVADKAKVKAADLAVSDLFDISVVSGKMDGEITIVLSAETLKNYVALLHDNDGSWEVVEGAKVEPCLIDAKAGESFQFVRTGYFTPDSKNPGTFIRTVTLKDGFKIQ